jgi:hypothetical protein
LTTLVCPSIYLKKKAFVETVVLRIGTGFEPVRPSDHGTFSFLGLINIKVDPDAKY